jgi:hypothetical protein
MAPNRKGQISVDEISPFDHFAEFVNRPNCMQRPVFQPVGTPGRFVSFPSVRRPSAFQYGRANRNRHT